MAQHSDPQRDPVQRQRSNNIRATVRALVVVYLIYLIFQKQFIEGIATSGGKL